MGSIPNARIMSAIEISKGILWREKAARKRITKDKAIHTLRVCESSALATKATAATPRKALFHPFPPSPHRQREKGRKGSTYSKKAGDPR
jgi:hypothetical protein